MGSKAVKATSVCAALEVFDIRTELADRTAKSERNRSATAFALEPSGAEQLGTVRKGRASVVVPCLIDFVTLHWIAKRSDFLHWS